MARISTIKPEFFTSEDIVNLSPLARLLYIAIWCEADKEGRLVWKPMTFKLRYFPGDNCDIQAMCAEIVNSGLVWLYGEGYAVIPAFKAHQHINPRESASQLPEPIETGTRKPRVGTRQPRDSDAQGGREGKGKEGNEDSRVDDTTMFDEFWSAYPKKKAKDDAGKAFDKRKPDRELLDSMLAAIATQCRSEDWTKDGGKFIPYPATWLNDGRWTDCDSIDMKASSSLPQWVTGAGFSTIAEANNEGCYQRTAHQFKNGKREVAA